MTIKILAKSEKRKGMLFERMIVTLLETLGYEGLKTNVLRSGSEIDIEGKSKITRQPFFCECKATKRKIDSSTFQQFVGKFLLEKIKNKDMVGLFFTLSPLTPVALENYTDLKNTKYKGCIILYEGRDILKLLIESKLIVSKDFINDKLKNIDYTLIDKYIVYTENGPYWVQILQENSKPIFFTVFDCYGNFLSKSASEEIKGLDENLSDKKYIGERVYEEMPTHSDLESILAKKFDELKKDLFIEMDKKSAKYPTTSDLEVVEEEKIIEKHEIPKNPFDGYTSAEMATDDQIATLFIEPPGFDVIKHNFNIIIEGNRGTGRSMLLRYLSIGAQIELLRENKNSYDLPFIGVYIKSSGAWLTAGRKESEISVLWIRLFTHLFNMMVFSRILSDVNLTEKTKVVELTDKEKLNVIEEMLKLWKVSDSQKENNKYPKLSLDFLEESVNQEISNTLRCLNTLELRLDESYFEGSLTSNHFLEDVCSILVDNIQAYRDKQFCILLDEYERYSESQQKIINGIINRSRNISFKIATTPFGMTFETIDDKALEKYNEFQLYDLNSIWYKSNDYKMFLKSLGNELLRHSFNGLDIDTLFPKDNNKKYLSGVDTFAILSSGVVTDFIQICCVAFGKAVDKSMNVHEGISPKVQDASIREVSHNKIHGLKTIPSKGMQLQNVINTLANIFRENYLKNGRETLEIEILEPYKLKTELKEIFEILVRYSYLQLRPVNIPPKTTGYHRNVYGLNRLLTPYYKLHYQSRHGLTIPGEIMNLILDEPFELIKYMSKGTRDDQIKQLKLEETTTSELKVSDMKKIDRIMPSTDEIFSEDLFVCALTFEDRSTEIIKRLDENCRFKNSFLFIHDTLKEVKNFEIPEIKARKLLENNSSELSLIVTDFDNPFKIRRDFRDLCNLKKLTLRNKRIAIDVTSFTKKSLLSLLDEIGEYNQIRILYSEPKEYLGAMGEESVGDSNIETLRGVINSKKKNLLVLLSGAGENNQRSELFYSIRPEHTILLYGGTPKDTAQLGWIKKSIEEDETLFRDYPTETLFMPTFDHMGAYSKLNEIYNNYSEKYNIIIFPSNNKIQLVGLYLFTREHPDVSIVTATPMVYSPRVYTQGVGNIYEICINQFLSKKELPEEIKKSADKYSIDNLPGRHINRVFIGGNYDLMAVLNEIAKYVKENSFRPIIAYNFDVPTENIHDFDLLLLHNCKYAIFDVTIPAGELIEIERTKDYGTNVLAVYNIRDSENTQPPSQITSMITSMNHIPFRGYSTFDDLRNIIEEWLQDKE